MRAGARVITLPFNLGIGGAVQTGYMAAPRRATTTSRSRSTATGSIRPPRSTGSDRRAGRRAAPTSSIGSRFLGERHVPRAARPPARASRVFARVVSRDRRHARDRHHVRLPRLQPPRDRASSPRAYPHDYPEVEAVIIAPPRGPAHRRGARARCASARAAARRSRPCARRTTCSRCSWPWRCCMLRRPVEAPGGTLTRVSETRVTRVRCPSGSLTGRRSMQHRDRHEHLEHVVRRPERRDRRAAALALAHLHGHLDDAQARRGGR